MNEFFYVAFHETWADVANGTHPAFATPEEAWVDARRIGEAIGVYEVQGLLGERPPVWFSRNLDWELTRYTLADAVEAARAANASQLPESHVYRVRQCEQCTPPEDPKPEGECWAVTNGIGVHLAGQTFEEAKAEAGRRARMYEGTTFYVVKYVGYCHLPGTTWGTEWPPERK